MKSLVVLLAHSISDYALKPLTEDGISALESALRSAVHFPDCTQLIVTVCPSQKPAIQAVCAQCLSSIEQKTVEILPFDGYEVQPLFKLLLPFVRGIDTVFFAWADSPFLDNVAACRLYEQHCKYKAEYSFADGYPEGLIPQITVAGLIPLFAEHAHSSAMPLSRSFLFDCIKKDINAYDLETMIAPDDVRHFRLCFYADTKAAWQLCSRFSGISAENYAAMAAERQQDLRCVPAYYALEINAAYPLTSLYRPLRYQTAGNDTTYMPLERIKYIIDSIAAFSETAVISLSLYGEPLQHPQLTAIIGHILSYPSLSVLIETSGLPVSSALCDAVAKIAREAPVRANGKEAVYWIVFVDAVSADMYGTVHQITEQDAAPFLTQAVGAVTQLARSFPQAVWAQITRMNENEAELEPFYRFWEKQQARPLIQKYDHVCKKLPDRRVADISPLERYPCWHLKRDISIWNDGVVSLCKEDIEQTVVLGNVFTDPLEVIWEKGQAYYQEHLQLPYKGLCEQCDEYYTYNF